MAATKNFEAYDTTATITCTMTSLASGSARESVVITNTVSLDLDYLVGLTFTVITGSPVTTGPYVNIYANGSVDGTLWPIIQLSGGTTFTTGTGDVSVGALASPSNLRLIGTFGIQTTTSSGERTFRTEPMSVANAFGGNIPPKFSIIVENQLGIAFSASTTTTATFLQVEPLYTTSGN
jgi:hypothetical protein